MRKILLISFFSFSALICFSQAKVEIGLKAGVNIANTDAGSLNSDAITALHGGLYGLIKVANFGIQPEVLWSKQGNDLSGIGEIDLSYVNMPVMLKFYLPLGLNFQLGPQFGILTDSKVDIDGTSFSDRLKDSDLSAVLGAGWDAPFGLQLSARYILGLSDVSQDIPGIDTIKNRTFQVSLGYKLIKIGR